ncbi:MAG: substrate-binding domain-containing protein [Usitatibacter sp.]
MKLRFVSAGAANALVTGIAAASGVQVEGHFGAVGAMLEKFGTGEECDVVILTRPQIDALAARGSVIASTVVDLGSAPTSIAVRAGDPLPQVSDETTLREALLAADAIYFPDPGKATAGIHFAKVLGLLGIHDIVAARIRTFPNGMTAMKAMGESSGRPIGCTQATEIHAVPAVRLVAPLPRGFDLATTYAAAVNAKALDRLGAESFVRRLGSLETRKARKAAGFD